MTRSDNSAYMTQTPLDEICTEPQLALITFSHISCHIFASLLQLLDPAMEGYMRSQENIAKRLQIIPPTLFYTYMSVATCISCSPSEVFVISVRNVPVGSGVTISFGKSKINDCHLICLPSKAHEKVIWFDVSVQKSF
nr:hypothetical protein BpHYR1_011981 [Ipomoea batatas]